MVCVPLMLVDCWLLIVAGCSLLIDVVVVLVLVVVVLVVAMMLMC